MGGLAVLALALRATAAPTPITTNDQRQEARARYAQAVEHFNNGEYAAAADDFLAVYKISPQPALLYNVAQAYRLGNDLEHALVYYQRFVKELPSARQRPDVERRIEELERRGTHAAAVSAPPPDMSAPTAKAKIGVTTPGKSDRLQEVADVIKQSRAAFRACFDKWSKAHPGVDGKVTLTFYLDPDGSCDQPDAKESGFLAPEVGDCIEETARGLRYPKSPSGKFTRFTYPFDFKAAVR